MPELINRHASDLLLEFLGIFRIVLLGGARQVGKTTLLKAVPGLSTVYLDRPGPFASATQDPMGFIEELRPPTAIDEFQRAGEPLLLAIKFKVDSDNTRGQFVLSGSANYLANRSITETLAGRIVRLTLWPLSLGERHGIKETFVDRLFEPAAWPPTGTPPMLDRPQIVDLILTGGYPEVVTQQMGRRARYHWFETYTSEVVSKEALRGIAGIRTDDDLLRVLHLLAARTGQVLNISDVAADAQLGRDTTANYIALLQALYLIRLVPAWSTNATTRAKRHPKVLFYDSGLAAYLCRAGEKTFAYDGDPRLAGGLFETAVLGELHKQASWSDQRVTLSHFRDRNGAEVDCILEDSRAGLVAGVEVKLTASPTSKDARHLIMLRDRLGSKFTVGVVVHAGIETLRLGERIWAVPFGALLRSD